MTLCGIGGFSSGPFVVLFRRLLGDPCGVCCGRRVQFLRASFRALRGFCAGFCMSFNNLMMICYKAVAAFLGLLSRCSSCGRLWPFFGAFIPSRVYVHASYKKGLVLPSAGLVRHLVVCCVYIALWRVLWAFLGLSGPSVAIGPRCCFRRSVRRLYVPRVLRNI